MTKTLSMVSRNIITSMLMHAYMLECRVHFKNDIQINCLFTQWK